MGQGRESLEADPLRPGQRGSWVLHLRRTPLTFLWLCASLWGERSAGPKEWAHLELTNRLYSRLPRPWNSLPKRPWACFLGLCVFVKGGWGYRGRLSPEYTLLKMHLTASVQTSRAKWWPWASLEIWDEMCILLSGRPFTAWDRSRSGRRGVEMALPPAASGTEHWGFQDFQV